MSALPLFRWVRWTPGRQGSGYRKMLLASSSRLRFDAYVIDYPPGTHVPSHTDAVKGRRHFRANLVLRGDQTFEGEAIFKLGPLVVFRPDIAPHAVARVTRRRIVLSVGVAL